MDKNNNLCGFQTLSSHTRYTFPDYKPRSPWLNADLQTLCNKIAPPEHQLDKYVHSPLLLPLEDGSGDALVATLYLPDMPEHNNRSFSTPLIVFIHGLGGSSQAIYVNTSAEYFLAEGYPVLTVNLRGVGDSGQHCCSHNHPGRSEDIGLLLDALQLRLRRDLFDNGVILMGFSMGGNIVLKFLGEKPDHPLVRAAITVSAPLDLALTSRNLLEWRNVGYQQYLLRRIKAASLRDNNDISEEEWNIIENAMSVWEVDEKFTAPHLGFDKVETYYEEFSSKNFLNRINVPTLLIHALDDPFVPNETYLEFNWEQHPMLHPILVECGGHNGFHGDGSFVPWHNRCALEFLKQLDLAIQEDEIQQPQTA